MSAPVQTAVTGSFGATGRSATFTPEANFPFNVSLSGFGSATVKLERSFDGGATWKVVISKTADYEDVWSEPESGVLWSWNCTAYSSGTIVYRISR
jgi:hypothetical protein